MILIKKKICICDFVEVHLIIEEMKSKNLQGFFRFRF